MNRVLTIFGTRPEAIKLAPVILEIQKHRNVFDHIVCVTALLSPDLNGPTIANRWTHVKVADLGDMERIAPVLSPDPALPV